MLARLSRFMVLLFAGALLALGAGERARPAQAGGVPPAPPGLLTALSAPPAAQAAIPVTATPGCALGWTQADTPSGHAGQLHAVAALAPNDIWAVGEYNDGNTLSLIEHWNGTTWAIVPNPNPAAPAGDVLYAVTALAPNNVWAVGWDYTNGSLIEHWDGGAWTVAPGPNLGQYGGRLLGVSAVAANDIWAVGYYGICTTGCTSPLLALHWNGTQWSTVALPNPGAAGNLQGVTARAANDIWAVGYTYNYPAPDQTLALHWNGTLWSIVSTPNVGSHNNLLQGVAATAANDVWAVGYYLTGTDRQTLIEHWDGSQWSVVPGAGGAGGQLQAVTALAANNIWAVGTLGYSQPLTLHWDGSAWSVVASPTPGARVILSGVAATGAGDVWAVGEYSNPTFTDLRLSVTEHWNGSQWDLVPSANMGGTIENTLRGVTAPAADDIWAAGYYSGQNGDRYNLILHRQNGVWSVVAGPSSYQNWLNGIAARTATDIWAVGTQSNAYTVIQHWDGSAWTTVPSPSPDQYNALVGVVAVSANDAWAVGYHHLYAGPAQTLIEHWNGTAWSVANSPNVGGLGAVAAVNGNDIWAVGEQILHWDGSLWSVVAQPANGGFNGVAAVTAGDVWAVGSTGSYPAVHSLIEHWNGTAWSVVSSPDIGALNGVAAGGPTSAWAVGQQVLRWDGTAWSLDPGAPTSTYYGVTARTADNAWAVGLAFDTLGRRTQAANFTTQPAFADVPGTAPFYPYIQTLACRGLLSGYQCGGPGEPCDAQNHPYYRPANILTRGQAAKIIVNAAGFNDPIPSAQQTFADVPPGQPFWLYIERLAGHGAISGYTCGGPGEPCDAANRPYYRPYAEVRRAHLAKIVTQAAGFLDPVPTTQQTFADVPVGQPFWLWVERAARHGLISGYQCGGPGEPCDAQNRPYFRAYGTATRGQAAKILAQSFFPTANVTAPGQK